MKYAAVAVSLALLLTGCASPGPLDEGRWFIPNPMSAGPVHFLARGLANAGLASVYAAAWLARSFGRHEREKHQQLACPP